MFTSILNLTNGLSIIDAIICTGVSLLLGLIISCIYMYKGSYSKHFVITLVLLPALVQGVIMMVNGNLGTSVAILGAFSLVRFRSLPGTSKEITSIFFAMAIGLSAGMGYISFAILLTTIIGITFIILTTIKFGEPKHIGKELKVVIPESLDYTGVFDDLFKKYTNSSVLTRVKTTNMGSMYELTYIIELKDSLKEKEMIDAIRCRNGNLTIICGEPQIKSELL